MITAAAVLIAGVLVWVGLHTLLTRRVDIDTIHAEESREASRRHARERHRRYLQICRGILRRENGLGVTVTPRPPRPLAKQDGQSLPRSTHRAVQRYMRKQAK